MKKTLSGTLAVLFLLVMALGAAFYFRPIEVLNRVGRVQLWRAGVSSHFVELGGYRIHYLEAGPNRLNAPMGTGSHADKPIVLVHGLGARADDWTLMMEGLAQQGFHVYALDLLGYGRSAQPDVDYSIPQEENIVLQFMDSQQLQQPDLAGWSMGGWIAAEFALDHPQRVRRLLLYDSAGLNFKAGFPQTLFQPQTPEQLAELTRWLTPHPQHLPEFIADDVLRNVRGNGWVVGRSMRSMVAGHDLLDTRLGNLHMPTLIIWGQADRLIPPSVAEQFHQGIPQSVLELAQGCGHLAPRECTSRILPETVKFLNTDPAPAGGEKVF